MRLGARRCCWLSLMFAVLITGPLFASAVAVQSSTAAGTELTSQSGLTITVTDTDVTLDPKDPYIWCSAIAEPIPIYIDTDKWETATLGNFGLQPEEAGWTAVKNVEAVLKPGSGKMTGLKLGLAKRRPATFNLQSLMTKGDLKRLEKWCQSTGNQNLRLTKFTVAVEDSAGTMKYVDPGIGVKR